MGQQMERELANEKWKDEEEVSKLIQIYHKFSVDLETIVQLNHDDSGNLIPAADAGIGANPNYADVVERLKSIEQLVNDFHEMERDLRSQVHKQVDVKFDARSLP